MHKYSQAKTCTTAIDKLVPEVERQLRTYLATGIYMTGNLAPKPSAACSGNCSYMAIGKAPAPL